MKREIYLDEFGNFIEAEYSAKHLLKCLYNKLIIEIIRIDEDVESVNEEDWNCFYFDFKINYRDCLDFILSWNYENEDRDLKKMFDLHRHCEMEQYFTLQYFPKLFNESQIKIRDVKLNISYKISDNYINSFKNKKKIAELERKQELLREYVIENPRYRIFEVDCIPGSIYEKVFENLRKLANFLYFQQNNMTIYEKLLEEPILDSEVNHEGSVYRTNARLKRLHRQTLDYFRNPDSIFVKRFWS